MQAKILRTVYGSDGPILPGEIVDISGWNVPNINALRKDGKISIIGEEGEVDMRESQALRLRVREQQEYIRELEQKLDGSKLLRRTPRKIKKEMH